MFIFEGPDRARKTTIAKAVSLALGIPFWERGPYLPHHVEGTSKSSVSDDIELHHPDSIWYVLDDMKTIEVFKRLNGNVLIDRHPYVSECVYRRLEGKPSPLEYRRIKTSQEMVVLCHHGGENKLIVDIYEQILKMYEMDYFLVDTTITEEAVESTITTIYQMAPSVGPKLL